MSAFFCHHAPKDEPKFPTVGFVCGTARSWCSALGQMRRAYYAQMFGRKEKCKAKLSKKNAIDLSGSIATSRKTRIALVFLHAPADYCGLWAGSRSCNLIGGVFELELSRDGLGTKGLRQNEIRNHGEVGDELQRVDQLQ